MDRGELFDEADAGEEQEEAAKQAKGKKGKKKASELNPDFEFAEAQEELSSWIPEEQLLDLPAKVRGSQTLESPTMCSPTHRALPWRRRLTSISASAKRSVW